VIDGVTRADWIFFVQRFCVEVAKSLKAANWYRIDANSLIGLQPVVEQRLERNPDAPTPYFEIVLLILSCSLWSLVSILCAIGLTVSFGARWFDTAIRYKRL